MIVICSRPGKLGNLLYVYASFMALAFEKGVRVTNPAFANYRAFFEQEQSMGGGNFQYAILNRIGRIMSRLHLGNKFVRAVSIDWSERVELEQEFERFIRPSVCLVLGFTYRANRLLQKHEDRIREFFAPNLTLQQKMDAFWTNHFQDGNPIVGIHIRRGDYRSFEGGRYFYELAEYIEIMRQVRKLPGLEAAIFFISSNEPLKAKEFADLPVVIAPGHEVQDIYLLSRCNYIAGPPSTYSIWASFYGQVPLHMIRDPKEEISLNAFQVQRSF